MALAQILVIIRIITQLEFNTSVNVSPCVSDKHHLSTDILVLTPYLHRTKIRKEKHLLSSVTEQEAGEVEEVWFHYLNRDVHLLKLI